MKWTWSFACQMLYCEEGDCYESWLSIAVLVVTWNLLAKLAQLANTLQKLMYPTHNYYTDGIMATFKIFRFFKKHSMYQKKKIQTYLRKTSHNQHGCNFKLVICLNNNEDPTTNAMSLLVECKYGECVNCNVCHVHTLGLFSSIHMIIHLGGLWQFWMRWFSLHANFSLHFIDSKAVGEIWSGL